VGKVNLSSRNQRKSNLHRPSPRHYLELVSRRNLPARSQPRNQRVRL
jgi:hypothetical protein